MEVIKYAVVDPNTGVVTNVILAEIGFTLPGVTLIPLVSTTPVDDMWVWNGTDFEKGPELLALEAAALAALQDEAWSTV